MNKFILISVLALASSFASAAERAPYKLCKTDNGVCTFHCGWDPGPNAVAPCTLVRGDEHCNPNVAVDLYQGVRPHVEIAITTALPTDNQPYQTLICKPMNEPHYAPDETFDQHVHRLFGGRKHRSH